MVMGTVGFLEERGRLNLGLGIPAGAATVLAAGRSLVHVINKRINRVDGRSPCCEPGPCQRGPVARSSATLRNNTPSRVEVTSAKII